MIEAVWARHGIRVATLFFPESVAEAVAAARRCRADVAEIRQVPEEQAGLAPFPSSRLDLTCDTETLMARMHKTCRYEIRRAQQEEVDIAAETPGEEGIARFLAWHGEFARRKGLDVPAPALLRQWREKETLFLSHAMIEGSVACWHLYLVDRTRGLGRLLCSGTNPDAAEAAHLGRANRLLHWRDIGHFRDDGLRLFDWGGCGEGATAGISAFKRSFGGEDFVTYEGLVPVSLKGRAALVARAALHGAREAVAGKEA